MHRHIGGVAQRPLAKAVSPSIRLIGAGCTGRASVTFRADQPGFGSLRCAGLVVQVAEAGDRLGMVGLHLRLGRELIEPRREVEVEPA